MRGAPFFGQFLKHCIGSKISTSVLFRALNVLLSVPLHVHHQNICFKISTSALIYIIGKYSWTFVIIFYFQTLVTLVYYRGSGYRKINPFHKTFSCPRNLRFVKQVDEDGTANISWTGGRYSIFIMWIFISRGFSTEGIWLKVIKRSQLNGIFKIDWTWCEHYKHTSVKLDWKIGEKKTELELSVTRALATRVAQVFHFESYGWALRTPEGLSGSSRKIYH